MPDQRPGITAHGRLVTYLVALLALAGLAGCGNDNNSNSGTATPAAQASATPAVQSTPSEQTAASTATPTSAITTGNETPTEVAAGATGTPRVTESGGTTPEVGATTTSTTGGTFTNPVITADFPDPFVLKEGDTYYAYSTNAASRNIPYTTSKDLVKWDSIKEAMPGFPTWAKLGGSNVWAPEVMKIGDKYLLYYTARDKVSNKQCVGVAAADAPSGRFEDSSDKPLVCQADQGGTIDASPFRDGDKLYLYYKNDGNCCGMPTWLWAQEMAPDGLSLVGEPAKLVVNDTAWEGRVVEAPTMWKHDDKYYLFFSGNNYAGFEYSVGYATCDGPMGPCTDAPENPILASRMDKKPLVIGPGHQTLIQVGDQTWIVYHVWNVTSAGLRGSNRQIYIDRLDWQDGKPVVKGPTTDPQPVP